MNVVNKKNKVLILAIASFGLAVSSGCNSKMNSEIRVKNPDSKVNPEPEKVIAEKPANKKPQSLVSSTDDYDNLSDDEKEKYETPPKQVKVKEHIILRGETKFTDIVYTADEKNVTITGKLQLKRQIENISPENIYNFEINGTIDGANRQIVIKARDIDRSNSGRVRLGGRVICLNLNEKNEVDCSQAVVDFLVQIKETKLTDQFKTVPEPVIETPAPPKPVVVDDDDDDDNDPTKPPPAPGTPPKVKAPIVVAEGKDSSLNGAVNTHVDADDDVDEILADDTPSPLVPPKPDDNKDPIKPKPKIIKRRIGVTTE